MITIYTWFGSIKLTNKDMDCTEEICDQIYTEVLDLINFNSRNK